MSNHAAELFSAVPKMHNCAQAVAAGFGEETLAEAMSVCGGGKAPGGLCGALYAALQLVPEENHASLIREFAGSAGSELCREIKAGTPVFPCLECVRCAADLVEKYR